jgi:multidrug efflux pump subunit AcrB
MWLVLAAMRRPITIIVAVIAVALAAGLALRRMPVDIFPDIGQPTIYVAQPYGGMDPSQMEGFITYYYEYHFLYITGIEHVESKSIQGAALMKLAFHAGTDMSQAMAQVVGYVNRARSFMPAGAVQPFIVRYDAGSVPVGQLVFSSPTRSPGEMQNIALNQVRPLFATLPGVSAPPPFGGNQRTVVVRLDPDRLRSYRISPEDAVAAVSKSTAVMPSGNVRIGDLTRIATTNATIGANVAELLDAPVRVTGPGAAVYLRDIASAEVGTDIITGYAHVNGKRTVYIQVTKRADASTLAVIERIKDAIPRMQAVCPPDVKIDLVFDQSKYATGAIRNLAIEGLLGALLTGLMVLVFLRDWRSAAIVILTIPFALLSSVVWLWATGQTINIMTLAGLALAVGVLVDEATVEIENIHSHLAAGTSRAGSVLSATRKTATARLLSMLCILSVFVPSFFMVGVGRQLFVPLSLAVGLAMISSYVLSSTLVPVLSTWWMREGHEAEFRGRLLSAYRWYVQRVVHFRWVVVAVYACVAAVILLLIAPRLGTEIFPPSGANQFQLRLRAPTGTRIERTEMIELKALDLVKQEVGPQNVLISTAFIGTQPASYPINTIYLWTSGPQEAVMLVALNPAARLGREELRERLRARFRRELPTVEISFEAGDIVSQVMSFGSATPIEVAVQGASLAANRAHAEKLRARLARISEIRDLQYAQPLDYPTVDVNIDRERAGQFGLTAAGVARSLVAATSSSRFIEPNYWRDPASGNGFQIQVEIPQSRMASLTDVAEISVMENGEPRPLLSDVASIKMGTALGEVERYNMQRVVSLTANIHDKPLGVVAREIREALRDVGDPPRGTTVNIRGQIPPLEETVSGLRTGLLLSIGVILLLLIANFQSLRLALAVVSTVPATLCGVVVALLLTGTTLNIQSFTGSIMAVGIGVANAILLVTFAEMTRRESGDSRLAAIEGSAGRLRAILMTATAMTAGMIPMAFGFGEGGEQTAPLGRAVIGGLVFATIATLTVLPATYAMLQRRAKVTSPSLLPSEPVALPSEVE